MINKSNLSLNNINKKEFGIIYFFKLLFKYGRAFENEIWKI